MQFRKRFLSDIHNYEVSFVNRAANKRKFLYFKGTGAVKCPHCGTIIKYERKGEDSKSCTLIRCEKCGYLFNPITKEGVIKMEILRKFIEDYSGDKFKPDEFAKEIEKSGEEVFEKATKMLNDYRDGFPDDLKEAVVTLAKGLYIATTEKSEDTDKTNNDDTAIKEKLKKNLSEDEFKKVKTLLQKQGDDKVPGKENDDDSIENQIKKTLSDEEFKKIEHIFKTADYNSNEKEIVKMLKDFNDRITTIENWPSIKIQ